MEQSTDMVIKVKYGDALRRFTSHVNGDSLDHNMSTLRTKIIHLFKFSEDADLLLTYTDIDGDVVTLTNDDELCDAAIYQHLNPLRINVYVNGNTAANNARNNTSTNIPPRTLSDLEFLPPQICFTIEEALRSVPEPFRNMLAKISEEVSKVAAFSPGATELADFFTKLGQSHFDTLCIQTPGSASVPERDVNNSGSPVAPGDLLLNLTMPPTANLLDLPLVKEQPKMGKSSHDQETSTIGKGVQMQKEDIQDKGKSVTATSSFSVPVVDCGQNTGLSSEPTAHLSSANLYECNKKQFEGSMPSSNFCGNTENGFMANPQSDSNPPSCHAGGSHNPASFCQRGAFGLHDGLFQAFHGGVSCDGCGMHPIMGPRYKSKVQENYDLCNICFPEIGNETDFIRIDRPVYRPPRPFRGFFGPHSPHHAFRGWGMRPPREKLESRFIHDVTIFDGTLIAPSTEFTKIWRMRNSGSVSWPRGTNLVWVGGDLFADRSSVELEIPVIGFSPSKEIDVAVDFRAPSMPGRYVSYWRLASPQGQKFGQRVWVHIQVENYGPTGRTGGVPFPFNWDAASQGVPNAGEANLEPVVEVQHSSPNQPIINIEYAKPSSDGAPGGSTDSTKLAFQDAFHAASKPVMPEMDFSAFYPVVDSYAVPSNPNDNPVSFVPYPVMDTMPMPFSAPLEVDSLVSYPAIDTSPASSSSPPIASVIPSGATLDDATEQALMRELEKLGFMEVELNREILRKNEYDLEQSVNDLCSFADWNPLLEELQDMGFNEKETNIKLLAKNGGSLKHAVLDLVNGKKV